MTTVKQTRGLLRLRWVTSPRHRTSIPAHNNKIFLTLSSKLGPKDRITAVLQNDDGTVIWISLFETVSLNTVCDSNADNNWESGCPVYFQLLMYRRLVFDRLTHCSLEWHMTWHTKVKFYFSDELQFAVSLVRTKTLKRDCQQRSLTNSLDNVT